MSALAERTLRGVPPRTAFGEVRAAILPAGDECLARCVGSRARIGLGT
jgi:hypothetical protein